MIPVGLHCNSLKPSNQSGTSCVSEDSLDWIATISDVLFPERGLRTADGVEHEVDTVIYGTGFHATDFRVRATGA